MYINSSLNLKRSSHDLDDGLFWLALSQRMHATSFITRQKTSYIAMDESRRVLTSTLVFFPMKKTMVISFDTGFDKSILFNMTYVYDVLRQEKVQS